MEKKAIPMERIEEGARVRLVRSIKSNGSYLEKNLIGTVVFCFPRGYEISFDGISKTFDIDAKYIENYLETSEVIDSQ